MNRLSNLKIQLIYQFISHIFFFENVFSQEILFSHGEIYTTETAVDHKKSTSDLYQFPGESDGDDYISTKSLIFVFKEISKKGWYIKSIYVGDVMNRQATFCTYYWALQKLTELLEVSNILHSKSYRESNQAYSCYSPIRAKSGYIP